jgi:hypothetical protein
MKNYNTFKTLMSVKRFALCEYHCKLPVQHGVNNNNKNINNNNNNNFESHESTASCLKSSNSPITSKDDSFIIKTDSIVNK